ncbi:MAG: nitroreductase family protein [Eggerthellaceae bacterium]|nr:nitroreductase family protein [Eggerthellaceae bacterium]
MNETLQNLTTRKSAKSYLPEHISKEEIDLIVEAGLNAPSGLNSQSALFIVVQDDKLVEKLNRLDSEHFLQMLRNCGIDVSADRKARPNPFHGAKDVIAVVARKDAPTYVYDGSLAIGNMLNAAWSMGIDSCWIHAAKEVFESAEGKEFLEQVGITEPVEGIGFCVLGHHDREKEKTRIKEGRVFYALPLTCRNPHLFKSV